MENKWMLNYWKYWQQLKNFFVNFFVMVAAVIVKIVKKEQVKTMENKEELKTENVEVKETEKPIEVKEEKNIDYDNLRKEFEKLQTQMNEIQKNNLKLQAQNTELHKKVVNEAIEPSEKVDNVVEYNAFDPSTWPSNRSNK